ncbi:hypothetical protein [uncultured Porticoccus sp.]|uniref:hypothetical protein n=1 Tax=uncultured Porticoccus sp. TaxID=1256050 RepID=UPI00260DC58B|nr:hypothetical protein [uncultured Porticoccus sp.]
MRINKLSIILLGGLLAMPPVSYSDTSESVGLAAGIMANALFSETEKRVFGEYLRRDYSGDDHKGSGKQKSLPPGLRKKLERGGELPPGWQKKVARGEVLDRELYLMSRDLPEDLLGRLPRSLDGTSLRQIDDRIFRVMDATNTVLDVFYLTTGQ